MLKIDKENITVNYKNEKIYQKYSVSDKMDKVYDHLLYSAVIDHFTSILKKKNFQIDGRQFYWMTIDEMEKDPEIKTKNMDVVNFVKEFIA